MYCPNCGEEIEEDAVYCPFCGAKLAEASAQPPTAIKRHVAITASVILLCFFFLMYILTVIDFITHEGFTIGAILHLFMGAFALVAAYFLWQSKGIGGVIGIMYAVIEMLWSLYSLGLYSLGIQYTLLDLVIDMGFDTILIILIVIGRKSLKFE